MNEHILAHIVETLESFASEGGPDDAAEGLLETIAQLATVERRGPGNALAQMLVLAEFLDEQLAHVPAVPAALHAVIASLPSAPVSDDEIASAALQVAAAVRRERELLVAAASRIVCADDVLYFHGVGRRHELFAATCARRLDGRVSIFVSCPDVAERSTRAELEAELLGRAITAVCEHHVRVEPVRLADCPGAVAVSDRVLLLATAFDPQCGLVALTGAELVYEAAMAYGPGATILLAQSDYARLTDVRSRAGFVTLAGDLQLRTIAAGSLRTITTQQQ